MPNPKGYIIYQGPSQLLGQQDVPIVAILTMESDNPKTGPMHQLWILRSDMPPTEAVWSGADSAICGDCALRGSGNHDRECYVNVAFAPSAVYRTFKRGLYPHATGLDPGTLPRPVRLGAYGDPAAVPAHIIGWLTRLAPGHTGYTHAWKTCDPTFRSLLMASVESPAQAREARLAGWRTARAGASTATSHWEIVCPATPEGGNRTVCASCTLCNGLTGGDTMHLRKHILFPAHGTLVKTRGRLINIS